MALPKPPLKPATRLDMSDIPTPKVRRATKKAAKKAAPVATETTVDQALIREDHSSITKAAEMVKADRASSPHKKASTEVTTPVPTKVAVRKASSSVAQKQSKTATKQKSEGHKLFILDTNVLLHDPTCLFRFEEHDIFLPMMALEELDHNKKGLTEVARNARQVSRTLDSLVADHEDLNQGVPLNSLGNKEATGQLFFETQKFEQLHQQELAADKPDNIILNVVQSLKQTETQREVILVSKDINMRLKAKALGLASEDYLNDHSLEDSDLVYDGVLQLPNDFWQRHGKDMESWIQGGTTFYKIKGPLCAEFLVNQFVYLEGDSPLYAQVKEVTGKTAVLATVRDYTHKKNNVWGVTARNREQNFALNLLMSPEVDFVSLLGQAGTGKTLLALAAGLTQVLETKRYTEIIMTRVTVPVGEDIGFLPGTEEEKMQPWMGALEDNLEFLHSGNNSENLQEWDRSASKELIHSHIKVRSLNFMRGRTFLNKFVIIDEAQNLTPKQMKTLITRAGPGTKIICLGNIAQIDTPYLTEGSSGLTYVVDRFKHWPHSGHVTLQKGERSRLADYASDVL
ncbi:phosphate starvation-inducible protein PhoH [Oligella sp. HMSC05A10]|uniref:PhoH family protein n=1 Tax=Oligella TaxID=90243 RepID=UPI0008A12D9D|nr:MULTISPECIES: PhoH family protein [Oligella]OFS87749.1 phosphate starvation-inducible protein PhoH [Oligella sp. HMSC05A10]SUA60152.1 Phosphate starvation-inducible protein psiH [Oligella urethralis]